MHVQTRPDDHGRFLLVVPEGPVRIRVYGPNNRNIYWRHDGPTPYSQDAELINVADGVRDIDFTCGRVHARVALPPEIAGEFWKASLVFADDLARVVAQRSRLDENPLEVTFSFVPPGRYFLLVKSPQRSTVFVPATYDTAAAEALTVRGDAETQHESAIPGVATISGSVTGSWQVLGFDRPTIRAYFGDLQVALTTTDGAERSRCLSWQVEPFACGSSSVT